VVVMMGIGVGVGAVSVVVAEAVVSVVVVVVSARWTMWVVLLATGVAWSWPSIISTVTVLATAAATGMVVQRRLIIRVSTSERQWR
jgi:hypothetical protein